MKLLEMFPAQDERKEDADIDWLDDLKFYIDNDHHMLSSFLFPAIKKHEKYIDHPKAYKIYLKPIMACCKHYCNKFDIENADEKFNKESLVKLAKQIAEEQKQYIEAGDYGGEIKKDKISEEKLQEGWKQNLAALGVAGALGLGSVGPAQASTDPASDKIVATLVIDGEQRMLDLSSKNFTDVRAAEKFVRDFMQQRGIDDYQYVIKGKGQTARCAGNCGLEFGNAKEGVSEGKFRKRDIEEKLISNDNLNDLKSKYLPDWEMLDHRILQAKYVAKDHRHAEDFISYINKVSEKMDHFAEVTQDVSEVTVKTTTFDVKGLTVLDFKLALQIDKFAENNDIEQVRMQGNFGMHEGKKDACYQKVKSRVKVWPSAYASGQLVQCRKRGAANWGKGSKK